MMFVFGHPSQNSSQDVTRSCSCFTDIMVPPVERSAYMYELRNCAENMVRERWTHLEVKPPVRRSHERRADEPVGPAFHIPMTQDRSLEELPSQMDFDWQDSVSPKGTPAVTEATEVAPKQAEENTNAQLSHLAKEPLVHVTQQRAERETDGATTGTN